MKIIIVPDSFKESMSAFEATEVMEAGFKKALPNAEYIKIPMADGGEGTVQALVDATYGEIVQKTVTGPDGKPINAFYGITGDRNTAIIEMATASGLHLMKKEERTPLKTTTKGTGELILAALNEGIRHIIIGIGGSATNDGGVGMAQALGARFLDKNSQLIGDGGGALGDLQRIDLKDLDPRLTDLDMEVACDVGNPLTGSQGASAVFGPQKGATEEMIPLLDDNLAHFARILICDHGIDVDKMEGAGAAGGLGAGLVAFLNARLKRGVDTVMEAVNLEAAIEGASLVITGEGKIDNQTAYGKTPMGVAQVAKKYGVPVIGIAGKINHGHEEEAVSEHGLDAVFSIAPGPVALHEAVENASNYTGKLAENIARLIRLKIE